MGFLKEKGRVKEIFMLNTDYGEKIKRAMTLVVRYSVHCAKKHYHWKADSFTRAVFNEGLV